MTKQKLKLSLYASLAVIALVAVVAIGGRVVAFNSEEAPETVMENVTIETYNEAPAEEGEDMLAGISSPNILFPYLNVNGDIVYHLTGKMFDASTTVVSLNMADYGITISSTSPVMASMVRLDIDAVATSTYLFTCGASTAPTAAPTYDLMTSSSIATSSGSGCIIENQLLTADNSNSECPDGGSIAKISLTSTYPYFVCNVTTAYETAFTDTTNTFDGNYAVRLEMTQ